MKKKKIIIVICIILLSVITIIGFIVFTPKTNDITLDDVTEKDSQIEKEKVYCTQESSISPTKRESLASISEKYYENFSIANTSINNMKEMYSYLKDKDFEQYKFIYYNSENNHYIGFRIIYSNYIPYANSIEENSGISYDEAKAYQAMYFIMWAKYGKGYISDDDLEYYNKDLEKISKADLKSVQVGNYKCFYQVIGDDVLYINAKLNGNSKRDEIFTMAYDSKMSPEDIIKKWYNGTIYSNKLQEINVNQNYSMIKTGMSYSDVVNILGQPTSSGVTGVLQYYVWNYDYRIIITVLFQNGRVYTKTYN